MEGALATREEKVGLFEKAVIMVSADLDSKRAKAKATKKRVP
jgi:hypothetical protein